MRAPMPGRAYLVRMERMHMRRSFPWVTTSAFACALIVSVALVGCGAANASGAAGGGAAINCGHVQGALAPHPTATATAAQAAENCFWNAYQQCQTASLTYTRLGVDTEDTYSFTLQRQGTACVLNETHDRAIAPQPAHRLGTYSCTGLTRQQDDSLAAHGCGQDGDITITAVGYSRARCSSARWIVRRLDRTRSPRGRRRARKARRWR